MNVNRLFTTLLTVLLFALVVPMGFAADYDTEAGQELAAAPRAETQIPVVEGQRQTKAYSLQADYSSGAKRGELRCRSEACKIETREEGPGQHHVSMYKRNESRLEARFGYRRGGRVQLGLYHRATVIGSSPITISVNGTQVVWGWSPSKRTWHSTTWDVTSYLQDGENTLEVRLGEAPKMYWFKRVELSSGADCLFRDAGNGPVTDSWDRVMREARIDFDNALKAKNDGNLRRARQALDVAIKKAEDVARNAQSPALRREGQDLARRARFELQNLGDGGHTGGFGDPEVYRQAYKFAYASSGLDMSEADADRFARQLADRMNLADFGRFQEAYKYAYSSQGLDKNRQGAQDFAWRMYNRNLNRFKELYRFAYSSQGLDKNREASERWAIEHMHVAPDFIQLYKEAYNYLYSSQGCDLNRADAERYGEELAAAGRAAFDRFRQDYRYAYGSSGMNMSKERAFTYALRRLHGQAY